MVQVVSSDAIQRFSQFRVIFSDHALERSGTLDRSSSSHGFGRSFYVT